MPNNADLSPDARALWFALKFHATEPTTAETGVITYVMRDGGAVTADANDIAQAMSLTVIDVAKALGTLALKDAIRMWRDESGKHRLNVNYDFESPLFGGVR